MHSDEPTLVEPLSTQLLRASFASDAASAELLRINARTGCVPERVLALRGLVRRSLMTDEEWRLGIADDDVVIRRETLLLLAHADGVASDRFAGVIALLSDTDELVVEAAAFALGEHEIVNAVDELCRVATSHDDARCRESAIAALGSIGDDRARASILAALSDKPPVRRRSIVALSNFEGPDIDAALATAAGDKDWQVRAAVAQLQQEDD